MHISPSKKYYIGVTSRNVNLRWKNGNGYKHQPYFWNAIQKYGWDNFEHIIIKDDLDKDSAFDMEKKLIKQYKSNISEYGYNCSIGGENGNLGHKHSDKTIEKMRNSAIGRNLSDEQKLKISNTLKGRKLSKELKEKLSEVHMGHDVSDDTKKKMSEKKRGRKWTENERNALSEHLKELHKTALPKAHEARKIKVKNLNTGKIFDSVIEASKFYNVNPANISRCCKGDRKRCGGYEWEYYKERKDEYEII